MREKSERLNEDEFLLAVIHDIRLHLRKSVVHAQFIERDVEASRSPELSAHLAEILSAGKEMATLLTRLAKYAAAGLAQSEQPAGDIGTLFDSALRRVADKNVNSEIDARPLRGCGVRTPYPIETVLGELLDNALKFRQGPVKISMIVEREQNSHVFGLKDTGIGFDSQFSERIFRPLERLHPTSVYPGSGLGLAICQRIVECHGGKLWAESKPGEGSTFWFTVPA